MMLTGISDLTEGCAIAGEHIRDGGGSKVWQGTGTTALQPARIAAPYTTAQGLLSSFLPAGN